MKPFDLIIFDWDGTLMDSQQRILACLRAATLEVNLDPLDDETYSNVIGLGLKEATEALFPQLSVDQIQKFSDHYRYHYLVEDRTHSPLFDGAEKVLQQLQDQGYWMAIATGKGREGLDMALKQSGIGDYFLTSRCASETFSKPHPQMLEEILDELGIDAHNALMIGDSEYDMQLATNAGTHSLAVSYGVHSLERLLKYEALGHIDKIVELPDWLNGLKINREQSLYE